MQSFPSRKREGLGVGMSPLHPYRPTPSPSRKREGSKRPLRRNISHTDGNMVRPSLQDGDHRTIEDTGDTL